MCIRDSKKLLQLLQQRARGLGIELRFETEIASAAELAKTHDLVVAADGLNSRTRNEFAAHFKPGIETRKNKFVWLGTHQKFDDAFTFIFEEMCIRDRPWASRIGPNAGRSGGAGNK